eukprot:4263178-Prymnesium_polylepis.2
MSGPALSRIRISGGVGPGVSDPHPVAARRCAVAVCACGCASASVHGDSQPSASPLRLGPRSADPVPD